ncbi:MAG: hypothetical protein ACQES5_04645 [Thermodesulfobacteriota bacterium]
METSRQKLAQAVLEECFWGDYNLSPVKLLEKLDNTNEGMDNFLFSKIIENSSHPSKYLRKLIPEDRLNVLIHRYLDKSQQKKRIRVVAANLTGRYDLAPEYAWKK